ncbi:hypothetical protein JNM05_16125 [bacterium]|nr:hypothetical protein [bacterium]
MNCLNNMLNSCIYAVVFLMCLSAAAEAQNNKLFGGSDTVQFHVEIRGKFSRQSVWNVNLINANVTSFQSRPKDMDISQTTLDMLNSEAINIFEEVLESYHIKHVSRNKKDYKTFRQRAEPIFTEGGDQYYRIEVVIAGDNGLGGHYGGLDIQLYFKSLHRSTNVVYGYSFRTLKIGSSEEETLSEMRRVFSEQLKESYDDWKASLDHDLKNPRFYLLLRFDVSDLSPKQQKFIRKELFPCLYSRADSLGYIDLKKFYYQIFYRLKNSDYGETEENYISRYADLLQFSMGSSDKYPCSLRKTPMENYRATFKIDSTEKMITIGWRKPDQANSK